MFVEMTCQCGASFQMDAQETKTLAEVWAHSFVNAHQVCGYMTKSSYSDAENMKRYDVIYKEEREKEL